MFDVLNGIRVLDFGKFVAAPSSTWLLSNVGAEVIKIEPPGGAPDREPFRVSEELDGAGFLQLHANKKSLTLDPSTPGGRDVLHKLVATSDVVVLGAPASTNKRQGLDYETLSKINPRLIYLNVSAFTSRGPRAEDVGFDGIGQVMSGSSYISGFGDQPTRSFCSFIDVSTGIYSAFAIACALLDRNKTGKGHDLETSLFTSGYAIMSWLLLEQELTKRNRRRSGNRAQSSAPSDMFRTKDGWIVVQTLGDSMFRRAAKLVGKPEWCDDPRFATDNSRADHGEILSAGVAEWCARHTSEQALALLRASRVPGAPVHSLQEALDEPQLAALGLLQNVPHPGRPDLRLMKAPFMADGEFPPILQRPPLAGEHTESLLRELGLSTERIAALREASAV